MSDIANFAANHQYWAGVREKKAAAEQEKEFNNYVSSIPLPHQRAQPAPPAQPQEGAAPAEPTAAGLQNAPAQPPSVADMTGYLTDLIGAHQKFKRPVPKELLDSAYSYMQNARDNGYHDALIQMSKGNPKGAEDAFNRSGLGRIAITDFKPTKTTIGGMEHDSYIATYHHLDENGQPFGQPIKADVTKELFSQLDLEKRFKLATEGMKAGADVAGAKAKMAEAETGRKKTAAEIASGGVGKKYKTETSEVSSALGEPAIDDEGKPITDMMSGRQVMNRNPKEEAAFWAWHEANGFTDTNESLPKYLAMKAGRKPAAEPEKKPKAAIDWSKY